VLVIHKFAVTPGPFKLTLPKRARVLTVQMQYDQPQMWALLDQNDFKVERSFAIVPTGAGVDATYDDLAYVGTFQMQGGALVWHLFEARP